LLAEVVILLHRAAEQARALRGASTAGKGLGIEFKDKPPIDRVTIRE